MHRPLLSLVSALILVSCSMAQGPERGAPLARKGAFGAAFAPLSGDEAKQAGVAAGLQAKVNRVIPGLTAEAIGLKEGDILAEVGGKAAGGQPGLVEFLRTKAAGDPLVVVVLRDGKRVTLQGKLVERPRQKSNDDFEVTYDQVVSKGKRIRMIITNPKGQTKRPTIFMIGGIGAYSIDGEYETTAYGTVLGPLARAGYTVVRMDKPGQGDSEGPAYTDLLFDDEMDVYLQGLRLAKTLPTVDPARITILGHSMGGSFAPLIAAQEPVAGVIPIGTIVKTFTEYLLENVRRQSILGGDSPAAVDAEIRGLAAVTHYMFGEGKSVAQIRQDHPQWVAALNGLTPDGKTFSGVGIPFFQQLARKNLAEAWSKTNAKVLALWGENDFISTEWDHGYIAEIVNRERPGTATFQRIPQSDHGFFRTTSPKNSRDTWGRGGQFNPNVIDILKEWLAKNVS